MSSKSIKRKPQHDQNSTYSPTYEKKSRKHRTRKGTPSHQAPSENGTEGFSSNESGNEVELPIDIKPRKMSPKSRRTPGRKTSSLVVSDDDQEDHLKSPTTKSRSSKETTKLTCSAHRQDGEPCQIKVKVSGPCHVHKYKRRTRCGELCGNNRGCKIPLNAHDKCLVHDYERGQKKKAAKSPKVGKKDRND